MLAEPATAITAPETLADRRPVQSCPVEHGQMDLTVTVEAKGPSSRWDVRVTLQDGRTDVCSGCLTIER